MSAPDILTLDLSDPNVQWIFGLMCFQCAPIAHVLQRNGHAIESKVEIEQSYVMAWLLRKYHELGKADDWRAKIDAELREMETRRKAAITA